MRTSIRVTIGVVLLATAVLAQIPDALQVSYAANLGAGPSIVNLTNGGASQPVGDFGFAFGFAPLLVLNDPGDICANVYVFAEDQQLIACCTCPLTPNHLKTLSVQKDLINNTLTPGVPKGVTIALLATDTSQPCDAASPGPFVSGLRAWGTTLHAAPGGGYAVTERPFSQADVGGTELDKMASFCGFIQANGSKYGICGSCREGAAGAARQ